jgi:hypothetical protein
LSLQSQLLARIIHDGPKQAIQATSAGQSSR